MSPDEEKKIIIDEDWKSQVQAEKDAAQQEKEQQPSGQADTPSEPHPARGPMPLLFQALRESGLVRPHRSSIFMS